MAPCKLLLVVFREGITVPIEDGRGLNGSIQANVRTSRKSDVRGLQYRDELEQVSPDRRGAMPRYFFNVYHGEPSMDGEGEELPDKHAAWNEATRTAGSILCDLDGRFQPGRNGS